MTRTCCVWCPDWPVVAARRRDPSLRAVPVIVRERVGARRARARRVGRGPGRRGDTRHAAAGSRGPVPRRGVRRCRRRARRRARSRSSRARSRRSRRASCSIVPGCARSRPAARRATSAATTRSPIRVHERCRRPRSAPRRHDVRIGIADGGFAARLAARRAAPGAPFVVEPGGSAAFFAPWPVSVLDDPELASLLVRLGLPTLGDVAALPADAVLARFGAEGRRFHDLARGLDAGPPVLVTPPPDLVEQTELDPPAARVDAGRVRGEGARRPAAVPARRARAGVHAGGDRGRDRARRAARALLAARPRAHARRARRAGALAARRLAGGAGERRRARPRLKSTIHDRRAHALAARSRRGRARRRSSARVLGRRSGRARPRRSRARARAGHARLRRGHHRGRAGWAHAGRAGAVGAVGRAARAAAAAGGRHRSRRVARRAAAAVPGARASIRRRPRSCATSTGTRSRCRDAASSRRHRRACECARCRAVVARCAGWAGPWASDVRWWDPLARRRCARWQVVVDCGDDAGDVACVVVVEAGRAGVEAIYD